jgi:hypothetical protein
MGAHAEHMRFLRSDELGCVNLFQVRARCCDCCSRLFLCVLFFVLCVFHI